MNLEIIEESQLNELIIGEPSITVKIADAGVN